LRKQKLEEKSKKSGKIFSISRGCTGFDCGVEAWVAGEAARPLNEQKTLIADTNDNYALAA